MAGGLLHGVVIEESVADRSVLEELTTVRTEAVTAQTATAEQPSQWPLWHFTAPADQADALAQRFRSALLGGPWYVDFAVGDEHVVVFWGRTFRYRRDDRDGAERARRHGRLVGVPEAQLDWED